MKFYIAEIGAYVDGGENSQYIIDEIWKFDVYGRDYEICAGDVVVDIGANQGFYSIYAAHKGAKVYAVEPEPKNFQYLTSNTSKLNVVAYEVAIGSGTAPVKLSIPNMGDLCSLGMVTSNEEYLKFLQNDLSGNGYSDVEVQGRSIDWLLSQILEKEIDLMKVDCEGAEFDLFSGLAIDTAKRIKRIVMETHCGYSQKELCSKLVSLGFAIKRYVKPSGLYKTGSLYAERSDENQKQIGAAILTVRRMNDNSIQLDASESFVIPNEEIEYLWNIGGSMCKTYGNPIIHISNFPEYTGMCEVGISCKAGKVDSDIECVFWDDENACLTSAVFVNENREFNLNVSNGCARISIPASCFPKDRRFANIVIGVSQLERRDMDGLLVYGAQKYIIAGRYCEVQIPNIPTNFALNLSIIDSSVRKFKFAIWAKENSE